MRSQWFIGLSRLVTGLAVLCLVFGTGGVGQAGTYNFTVLVKTGDTIDGKTLSAAVSFMPGPRPGPMSPSTTAIPGNRLGPTCPASLCMTFW